MDAVLRFMSNTDGLVAKSISISSSSRRMRLPGLTSVSCMRYGVNGRGTGRKRLLGISIDAPERVIVEKVVS